MHRWGSGKMSAILRTALAVTLATLLAACGIQESMERADTEIAAFHSNLGKQDYDAIWKTTSGEFREVTSKEEFEQLLAAIHGNFGAVKKTEQNGWKTNTNNGVSTVEIGTRTTYEQGVLQENFTYVWQGEQLRLLGYNFKQQ